MLCYDRIDDYEGTEVNESTKSKECDVCHYWYLLHKGCKFQTNVCNWCHDLLMLSMNFSSTAISKTKNDNCCYIISGISRREAKKLVQNIDLTIKIGKT